MWLASLLVLSSFACAKEEPISDLVDKVIDELKAQATIICDCHEQLGYASISECETAYGYIGPAQRRCVIEAYQQDESAARDYAECVTPLEQEYTACANMRLDCSDLTSLDPCGDDYQVGLDQCIQLPQSIVRDLEACFG